MYFRNIEEIICKKFINGEKKIVSIGGGAFMNKNIRAIISKGWENRFGLMLTEIFCLIVSENLKI